MYIFVQCINSEINNCTSLITCNEYCDFLSYVEHFGIVSLWFIYQEDCFLTVSVSEIFHTFS